MNLSGEKCHKCKKSFSKEDGSWPQYFAISLSCNYHLDCLPKCYFCNSKDSRVPPYSEWLTYAPDFDIWKKYKRKTNPLSAAAQYLLYGPEYKLDYSLGFALNTVLKTLSKPSSADIDRPGHYACAACIDRNNAETVRQAQIQATEQAEYLDQIKKQKAKEAKEAKELLIKRQKEAPSFAAAGIHDYLIEMYVEDKIPEQVLLLISSVFNETRSSEDIVFLLKFILEIRNEANWADINHWKEQFRLLQLMVEISEKKSISLIAISDCVTSKFLGKVSSASDSDFVFDADCIKRIDHLLTWIETDEGTIIFDGIFSEPQKITYEKALQLLECGFEGQPEALMNVIEGGMNWKVVAVKYGFYQL